MTANRIMSAAYIRWIVADSEEDEMNAYPASVNISDSKHAWAISTFFHGRIFQCEGLEACLTSAGRDQNVQLEGVRIDRCANRAAAISMGQYGAYFTTFPLPIKIRSFDNRIVKGIEGTRKSVRSVTIKIPATQLDAILDI